MRLLKLCATLAIILTSSFGECLAADAPVERILAEINLARTTPQHYARLLEAQMAGDRTDAKAVREAIRFLEKARPLPPLALSQGLSAGAQLHVGDQGPIGGRGHSGSRGSTMTSRMSQFGQWMGGAGENIYYGRRNARGTVCALIVDAGVPGRGHRKNLFSPLFRVTGIATGAHAAFGSMCVMDFAGGFVESGTIAAR